MELEEVFFVMSVPPFCHESLQKGSGTFVGENGPVSRSAEG